jgi:hypothetical protein
VLQEIHLNGRHFTWSNEQAHLTLERIDHVFISNEWDDIFPDHKHHSLSSLCSDHVPLLLHTEDEIQAGKHFHFPSFWPRFPGFHDVVARAWHYLLGNVSTFTRLDWLLHNMARFLKSWSDRTIGNIRIQLETAKEIVLRLEITRDLRQLSASEEDLCKHLKLKSLALVSLPRTIAQQESRILWLSEGGAPTHFFHTHTNARRKRKCISSLVYDGQTLVAEHRNAEALFKYYDILMAEPTQRSTTINLDLHNLP